MHYRRHLQQKPNNMTNPLNLNLIFFTSTKGHFGHKDIYKHTLNDLATKIDPKLLDKKVAHIKISPGEEDLAVEMRAFLYQWGFNEVLSTVADWSHNANHGEEYTKDITKTLDFLSTYGAAEYTLWMEDDYVFQYKNSLFKLKDPFQMAINSLKDDLGNMVVRFNLDKPSPNAIEKVNCCVNRQKENYTQWGPTVTFQPTIYRTKDLWWAYCIFIKNNWEKLKNVHIELRSGYSLFPLTNKKEPFLEFDYDIARSVHIGVKNYKEILDRLTKPQS